MTPPQPPTPTSVILASVGTIPVAVPLTDVESIESLDSADDATLLELERAWNLPSSEGTPRVIRIRKDDRNLSIVLRGSMHHTQISEFPCPVPAFVSAVERAGVAGMFLHDDGVTLLLDASTLCEGP